MRVLLGVVAVLAALWSGWWLIGSTAKQNAIDSWLNQRRAAGWTVAYSDFRVVGFPNRFDSRFTGLELHDPISGLGWKTPLFHILALSYRPNHIIAAFANSQIVSLPLEDVTIESSEMMASVTFEPDTLLAVRETLLRTKALRMVGESGWQMGARSLDLSTRRNAGTAFAHDVVFDAVSVAPTAAFRRNLDPKGRLPAQIARVFLDMVLGFDAPWDRVAIESGAPEVTRISLNGLNVVWGDLGLAGSGALDVAPDGVISGRIDLEVRNWPGVLDLFASTGVLPVETIGTIRAGLTLLTSGSADPTLLRVPLILSDGAMALGPVPLGGAPYFVRKRNE